jgi:G3E family GTPase
MNGITKLFSTAADINEGKEEEKKQVPITLLAGFLGSGKTSTLQNLLTNNDGLKIGIIVNDIASINIDSKLLSNPNINISPDETVELQNGCACCSLADELLTSVENLLSGGRHLDAIVVELSGVADPVAVKSNWEQAVFVDHPATKIAKMDKIVTLVDSSTFGTDWMTWDTSGDRDGWVDPNDCEADKKVPELLAEQVEAADVLVINKIDLAGEEQVAVATGLVRNLNKDARLFETKFGQLSVKEGIQAAKVERKPKEQDCNEPDCTDSSHDHAHSHDHGGEDCSDPACADASHDHSLSHDTEEACSDPGCTDPSHSHAVDEDCAEPGCTDPSHSHSHSHDHGTSADKLGISNFVYQSDRPFNPTKLLTVLNKWPVPIKEELDLGQLSDAAEEGYSIDGNEERSTFVGVLRSKGFCWMAPTKWIGANDDVWRHNTAMYWSHAGKQFGISTAGKWWGTITNEQMKSYFSTNEKEYERILREDFKSDEFGDRRQELVFIGANINEEEITKALDDCLCDDNEMETYRQQLRNFEETTFTTQAKPIKTVGPDDSGGPSLFDEGSLDHMDGGTNIRGD